MWLLNVVVVITFLFFILNVVKRTIKQKEIYLYVITALAIIFEILLIVFLIKDVRMHSLVQVLVLIFAYLIPMGVTILNSANISIRLKILYAIAQLAYYLRKYEFAAGLLKGAIKKDKNNINFYSLRSKALEQMGDLAGARDMLFKVVELDRNNKVVYYELSKILEKEDKKDTALVMLSHALKLDKDYFEAKEMMGIIYSEIGRLNEALIIYEELATSGNGTYNTYYNLAIIYWKNNQIDQAIKAYNISIGMNPKLYEAYYALGKLYFIQENYEQSISNLLKAIKDVDSEAKAEYLLGQVYIKQEQIDKAVDCLRNAASIDMSYLEKAKQDDIYKLIFKKILELENENKRDVLQECDEEEA